jgi:hypothetical protein
MYSVLKTAIDAGSRLGVVDPDPAAFHPGSRIRSIDLIITKKTGG